MTRPRMLDLFCCAGGAARGYVEAGFDVTGIDHRPQPRYLLSGASRFIQADALEYLAEHGAEYDVIHASPPCHAYVQWRGINREKHGSTPDHPDLLATTRNVLIATGLPWVIENVVGAPMVRPVILCGSHFGLGVRRHRLFESSLVLFGAGPCRHSRNLLAVYGKLDGRRICTRADGSEARAARTLEQAQYAMGIDWMAWDELTQAIPPAYTRWVGRQIMRVLEAP